MANLAEPQVTRGNYALGLVLEGILTDLTALKSAHDTLATKLNSDGGVSDTDYAAASTLVTKNT